MQNDENKGSKELKFRWKDYSKGLRTFYLVSIPIDFVLLILIFMEIRSNFFWYAICSLSITTLTLVSSFWLRREYNGWVKKVGIDNVNRSNRERAILVVGVIAIIIVTAFLSYLFL